MSVNVNEVGAIFVLIDSVVLEDLVIESTWADYYAGHDYEVEVCCERETEEEARTKMGYAGKAMMFLNLVFICPSHTADIAGR